MASLFRCRKHVSSSCGACPIRVVTRAIPPRRVPSKGAFVTTAPTIDDNDVILAFGSTRILPCTRGMERWFSSSASGCLRCWTAGCITALHSVVESLVQTPALALIQLTTVWYACQRRHCSFRRCRVHNASAVGILYQLDGDDGRRLGNRALIMWRDGVPRKSEDSQKLRGGQDSRRIRERNAERGATGAHSCPRSRHSPPTRATKGRCLAGVGGGGGGGGGGSDLVFM